MLNEQQINELFRFLKTSHSGYTKKEVMAHFGWTIKEFNHGVRVLMVEDLVKVFSPGRYHPNKFFVEEN